MMTTPAETSDPATASHLRALAEPSAAELRAARHRAGDAAAYRAAEVAWARMPSELGPLLLASTDRGVVMLAYGPPEPALDRLARELSPRVVEAPRTLEPVRRQLDELLTGHRRSVDVTLDWRLVRPGFTARVLRATAALGFGETATYRDVARAAGSPRGARAAGQALGSNPLPILVPCHRVLASDGGLGGYTSGTERKRRLLAIEGVDVA